MNWTSKKPPKAPKWNPTAKPPHVREADESEAGKTQADKPKKKKRQASATERAVGLLARREHSQHELTQKLIQRGFSEEDVAKAMEHLLETDLQSDKRFVESMIRHRAGQGHGPIRIDADLRFHHLEEALLQTAMHASEIDWVHVARDVVLSRFGTPPFDYQTRGKIITFLMRRGFTPDLGRQAIEAAGETER